MSKFLGLDRVFKLFDLIRQNGGIRASYMKLYRFVAEKKNIT